MKRFYISILLATFQIIYYLGWVSYNNNSDIEIMDETKNIENRILLVNNEEIPAIFENYSVVTPDTLEQPEFKFQLISTRNRFN